MAYFTQLLLQFISECNSERIIKISSKFLKVITCTCVFVCVFSLFFYGFFLIQINDDDDDDDDDGDKGLCACFLTHGVYQIEKQKKIVTKNVWMSIFRKKEESTGIRIKLQRQMERDGDTLLP